MRTKNTNTMYRRRTVRPDGNVYRQTRKLAGAANPRRRGEGISGAARIVLAVVVLVVIAMVLWLSRR